MYRLLIFLFFLSAPLFGQAQSFSEDWLGEWKGTLKIHNAQGVQQTVAMGLNIKTLTDSTWTWQIIYGEGAQQQLRDYELQLGQEGQYILDEKNSIKLYLSYINNAFESLFEVSGTQLLISYEMRNDKIVFRTVSSGDKEPMKTGGVDGVPEVTAKKVRTTQIAILAKS